EGGGWANVGTAKPSSATARPRPAKTAKTGRVPRLTIPSPANSKTMLADGSGGRKTMREIAGRHAAIPGCRRRDTDLMAIGHDRSTHPHSTWRTYSASTTRLD